MTKMINSTVTPITAPVAFVLADLTKGDPSNYTIIDGHMAVSERVAQGDLLTQQFTHAERHIDTLTKGIEIDPIGGEDFKTLHETDKSNGKVFASVHKMVLGGHGKLERQKFHIHPPGTPEYPQSSLRAVIAFPVANIGQDDASGIVFEWFGYQDAETVPPNDEHNHYSKKGVPVSPLYRVEMPPGKVSLVVFGEGVHRFHGNGSAISTHFLDAVTERSSFKGNTMGWIPADGQPEKPSQTLQVIPNTEGALTTGLSRLSTHQMYNHFLKVSKETVDRLAEQGLDHENPLTPQQLELYVTALREGPGAPGDGAMG